MSKVEEGLVYTESHEWVKVDGTVAIVGISDYAQAQLGDITYVELPEVEDEFKAGEIVGAVESVKTSGEIVTPVSGKVVACNTDLLNSPQLVNEQPYLSWLVKIEMSDLSELKSLLSPTAYEKIIE